MEEGKGRNKPAEYLSFIVRAILASFGWNALTVFLMYSVRISQ